MVLEPQKAVGGTAAPKRRRLGRGGWRAMGATGVDYVHYVLFTVVKKQCAYEFLHLMNST